MKLDKFPPGAELDSNAMQGWLSKLWLYVSKLASDNDIMVETPTKGFVLRSPNLHYWRATISNAGVVTWTDLGLTKP